MGFSLLSKNWNANQAKSPIVSYRQTGAGKYDEAAFCNGRT